MYELIVKIFAKIGIPEIFAQIIWPVFPFVAVAILMVFVVIFLVLLERKLLAIFTIRKGPNRVGPNGYLQTFADAIKLLFKEDIMSDETNKFLFTIAPILAFAPIMVVYGLVPFTENLLAINLAAGIFAILAISSLTTIGIVLAGWSSNNKYSLLGAMRTVAQSISYEIPLVISALAITVLAGSMNMQDIVAAQQGSFGLFNWFVMPSALGFITFFICSLAELNRIPFDLPEAESELVSGYNTEYSGMKFALFFLGEYAGLFIISVLIATLFFGGYLSPFGEYLINLLFGSFIENKEFLNFFVHLEQGFWIIFKSYIIIFFIIWVRATLPRVRADQLTAFSWKILLPLALINLFIVSIYRYFLPLS